MTVRPRAFERGCVIVGVATFVVYLVAEIFAKHNTIFTTATISIIWASLLPGTLLAREYYLIFARMELFRKRTIEKGVATVAIIALCAFAPVGLVSAIADQLANNIGRRVEIPILVEKLHDNGKPMKCRYKATMTLPPSNKRHQLCVSKEAFRELNIGEPNVAHVRVSAIGVALQKFGTQL